MLVKRRQVQALGVVDATLGVAHRDDVEPCLGKQASGGLADLAVALHRDGRRLVVYVQVLEGLQGQISGSAAGRLDSAFRASHVDRLARHRGRDRVALVHGNGVHDPRHDLRAGAHIRRGDVLFRADEDRDLGRVAPGQVLELVLAQLARIDRDGAFRPAIGDADGSALPGHEHRERLDQVEVDVRVVPDAALGRSAADVVLNTPAGEDVHRTIVQTDRKVHRQLALDLAETSPCVIGKADDVRCGVESTLGGLERGSASFDRHVTASDSNSLVAAGRAWITRPAENWQRCHPAG